MYRRTLQYAALQARARARIGKLPRRSDFESAIADSGRGLLDGLEAFRGFWLDGLSASVSGDALERHFSARVRRLLGEAAGWLPGQPWRRFGACLTLAPDIFWVAPIASGQDPGPVLDRDSPLQAVLRVAAGQRRALLVTTPFGAYLESLESVEERWRQELIASVPQLPVAEQRPLDRLLHSLGDYLSAARREYRRIAHAVDERENGKEPATGTWRHHLELERRLRVLLAGDPFHASLVLVYVLLELLTMEKIRALLVSRQRGWAPPAALTVTA